MTNTPTPQPPTHFTDLADALSGLSGLFKEAMDIHDAERDAFWNGLTPHQRLLAFCNVVKGLKKAELVDGLSYRGVLYEEFGFGLDAYVLAQHNGFLEIHNAIVSVPAPPLSEDGEAVG